MDVIMNEKILSILNEIEQTVDKLADENEINRISYFKVGDLIDQAKKLINENGQQLRTKENFKMNKIPCPECQSDNTKLVKEIHCVEIWKCENCGEFEN
jgi:cytochrome c